MLRRHPPNQLAPETSASVWKNPICKTSAPPYLHSKYKMRRSFHLTTARGAADYFESKMDAKIKRTPFFKANPSNRYVICHQTRLIDADEKRRRGGSGVTSPHFSGQKMYAYMRVVKERTNGRRRSRKSDV